MDMDINLIMKYTLVYGSHNASLLLLYHKGDNHRVVGKRKTEKDRM